ncbi:hypothetical protein PS639_04578 [Pseudomonas fluorescens]|nr:hypothetical protein PS639_04578 [Pseudomonas fluorescens]
MASSYQGQQLTAEEVRINYRKRFFAADPLIAPTIVDAIPGDADGLMPIDKINAALEVEIPLWSDRPPTPGLSLKDILVLEYSHSGLPGYVPIGSPEDILDQDAFPDSNFPLERQIPLDVISSFEGTLKFRYTVTSWNGSTRNAESPVTIDRTGTIRPGTPVAFDVVEPLITDAVLTRDKGVKCVVPDFVEDKKDFVKVAVGWMADLPEDEADFPDLVAFFDLLPASREILVPEKFVTDIGSRTKYVVYFLYDKAGNRSEMSLPKSVQVALGTLPGALKPCTVPLADDGLIDRADAALPTHVHIEEYTGWSRDDGIIVSWGTNKLARTSVGTHLPFPLKITVPWAHMSAEYNFTSTPHVQPVDVDYTILRGDYTTWLDDSSGYYFDGVLKFNRFQNESDVHLSDGKKTKGSYDNNAVGASLEFGRHIKLADDYFVEPYTQLSGVVIQGQSYDLDNGLTAEGDRTRSLLGKVGATAGRNFKLGQGKVVQPYVRAAYAHEFAKNNEVEVNNNVFNNDLSGSRGELGAGIAMTLTDRVSLHTDIDYSNGDKIEQPWGFNIGARYSW